MGLHIKGTGMYVPPTVVTNDDMATVVETNDEWITTRTGIKTRHFSNGELTYQMGAKASEQAIRNAGLKPDQIDMVLATTVSGDFMTPSLACLTANELGIADAVCMDVNCACAGFVYAMDLAEKYLRDGECENVLVVSAEILSRLTDFTDRATCVLFGDGAAACVVSRADTVFSSYLKGRPAGVDKLFCKGSDFTNPLFEVTMNWNSEKYSNAKENALCMEGSEVYKFATAVMPEAVEAAAEKAGLAVEDIDLIIPHQANIRIVNTAVKRLGLPVEKFFINVSEYGNTSSASIPIGLAEAAAQGRLKKGDKVCLVGFGAGLTYGAVVVEW